MFNELLNFQMALFDSEQSPKAKKNSKVLLDQMVIEFVYDYNFFLVVAAHIHSELISKMQQSLKICW